MMDFPSLLAIQDGKPEAQEFLLYKGIRVYHAYRHDEIEADNRYTLKYSLVPGDSSIWGGAFDLQDLPLPPGVEASALVTGGHSVRDLHARIIKHALDTGALNRQLEVAIDSLDLDDDVFERLQAPATPEDEAAGPYTHLEEEAREFLENLRAELAQEYLAVMPETAESLDDPDQHDPSAWHAAWRMAQIAICKFPDAAQLGLTPKQPLPGAVEYDTVIEGPEGRGRVIARHYSQDPEDTEWASYVIQLDAGGTYTVADSALFSDAYRLIAPDAPEAMPVAAARKAKVPRMRG